jgi:hypothetical protein
MGFEPGWKYQAGAESVLGFVNGKSRWIGCDLEEDASRLPEVDRAEIDPVDDGSDVIP